MILNYFDQIKTIVNQYGSTSFVLETNVSFETRSGGQGYLTGRITFVDGSELHFSEYLDEARDEIDKVMYTYHYQNVNRQLIYINIIFAYLMCKLFATTKNTHQILGMQGCKYLKSHPLPPSKGGLGHA